MEGAVADIATKVIEYDDDSLSYVIARFELIHRHDSASITEAMYARLQLPDGLDEHKKVILDSLTGHLFILALETWRRKEPFWTTAQPFFNRKQLLLDKFLREAWTALSQEDTGYQELVDLNKQLNLPFISQLKDLGLSIHILLPRGVPKRTVLFQQLGIEPCRMKPDVRLLTADILRDYMAMSVARRNPYFPHSQ